MTEGDVVTSAEVVLSSRELGTGTIYFDGTINLSQSGCFVNNYGYDVCTETGSIAPTSLINGTYWVTLENGMDTLGDPVYWDENQGVGCHSPGCPSYATESFLGSIPSEAFSILGSPVGQGSVPEPGSLALVVAGFAVVAGGVRRRFGS